MMSPAVCGDSRLFAAIAGLVNRYAYRVSVGLHQSKQRRDVEEFCAALYLGGPVTGLERILSKNSCNQLPTYFRDISGQMLFPRSGWYASTRGFEKKGGDVCESEGIGILSTQYSRPHSATSLAS